MTWLDLVVVGVLLLATIGGYAQGFVRGIARLLGLLAILVVGGGITLRFADQPTAQVALVWAVSGITLATVVVGATVWLFTRAVPRFVHRQIGNRLLGIVPAVLEALVVVALLLTLAEQLAPQQATQELIRTGMVTGPLLVPFQQLEQALLAG